MLWYRLLEQKNKLLDLLKQLDQGQQLGNRSTALNVELILLEMEGMRKALHPVHYPLTYEHLLSELSNHFS